MPKGTPGNQGTPRPEPSVEKTPKPTVPVFYTFCRCALIGSLLIQVLRVMGAIAFSWNVVLVYVLLALALVEAVFDPLFRYRFARGLIIFLVAGIAIWFTVAVVLAVPQFAYDAWVIPGDYPDGKVIGKIKWRPKHYSDLRVQLTDISGGDYDNLDITLIPTEQENGQEMTSPLVDISQVTEVPGVSFINGSHIAEAHSSGNDPKTGQPFQEPMELVRPRVKCQNMHSGDVLQIVVAVAAGMGPDLPDEMYGPKVFPTKLRIDGTVRRGSQSLTIHKELNIRMTK